MNTKESKLPALCSLHLKTQFIYGRNPPSSPLDLNSPFSNNTVLYAVSRSSTSKRLGRLIKESKNYLESLQSSEVKLRRLNHQLACISHNTCSVIGNEFFNNLAQSLASIFRVRYVIIGKCIPGKKIKTLAFWSKNNFSENIVYNQEGTPCEKMTDMNVHHFPHSVQEHFPNDLLLVEHGIESYIGMPIFDTENQLIGLVSIMDEKPITYYAHYSSILNIIASRCGSEIERMDAKARLESKTLELSKSNQALKDFISIASHDLRSPAGKIALFGSRLIEKIDNLEPESKKYLMKMQKSALRMQELIDDLQVFSQTSIHTEPSKKINLEKIFYQMIADLGLSTLENDGQIHVGSLPTIEGNLDQMRLLFQNLLSNAIKFHAQDTPPKIEIYSRACEQVSWAISIKDQGIGFDEKYTDRIFRPFERLHGKSAYEGTGMGLALCQKIVEGHGGTIQAHGKPGQGACFTVVLPAIHQT